MAKHGATHSSETVFDIKMVKKHEIMKKIAFWWQGLLYNMVFLQKVSNSSSRKMLESDCFPPYKGPKKIFFRKSEFETSRNIFQATAQ